MPKLSYKQQASKALDLLESSKLIPAVKRHLADELLTCPQSEMGQIRQRALLADTFLLELRALVNQGDLKYSGN